MSIRCQLCNENMATFHLVDFEASGISKEVHLCDKCTQGQSGQGQLLAQFVAQVGLEGHKEGDEDTRKCPDCGSSFRDFQKVARLGCARDYELFDAELEPLILRVHGAKEHVGKVPIRGSRLRLYRAELEGLQSRLDRVISEEKFEEAAVVRDRIAELLKSIETGSKLGDPSVDDGDESIDPAAPRGDHVD